MTVVSLAAHREQRDGAGIKTCPCGTAWFELRGGPTAPGVVTFDNSGRVVGYAGIPTCTRCGRPMAP